MNSPKVSVVIPVYNTERYIADTLYSILNQTLRDIEVIVVNDGSTDNSLSIIEKIATEDSRVFVISQNNGGVSRARNTGVEYIKGDFVYFIDSDDLLDSDALETCYEKCIQEKLDFVFFNADSFLDADNSGNKLNYNRLIQLEKDVVSGPEMLSYLIENNIFKTPVWFNFIRTAYIKKIKLSFYPGIIHEDELYSFKLYLNAERIGYIPRTFSQRRIREGSIMTKKFSWVNMTGYLTVTSELLDYRQSLSETNRKILDLFLTKTLNAVIWIAHTMEFKDKKRILSECIERKCMRYISFRSWMVLFFKSRNK